MRFAIRCFRREEDGTLLDGKIYYDNETSELFDQDNERFEDDSYQERQWPTFPQTSKETPLSKNLNAIKTLKIQLGLSCNYSCNYCSQRFVPHAEETSNPDYAQKFLDNIDTWLVSVPEKIEIWGGEPFVYWKVMKPLVEGLKNKFPTTRFTVITNGSVLTPEINEWVDAMDFNVAISHDGPGQHVRGPNPLDDPETKKNIMDLYGRLAPKGKISFNAMIHRNNQDREAIQAYFREIIGHDNFNIGEGGIIDPYDEGGEANTLQTVEEHVNYRRMTFDQIRNFKAMNFQIIRERLREWHETLINRRPSYSLGQKCGMDRLDTISVDLRGNVLTCQNVSPVSFAPNKMSHKIGHVSQPESIKLRTATHWAFRDKCKTCPVLQACKGSCMFLEGDMFNRACDNAYSDHIPFFAAAIENITGYIPYYIENEELPEDRRHIWGVEAEEK